MKKRKTPSDRAIDATEMKAQLEILIEWTMVNGSLKSLDHRVPKRIAESILRMLEGVPVPNPRDTSATKSPVRKPA